MLRNASSWPPLGMRSTRLSCGGDAENAGVETTGATTHGTVRHQ